MAAGSPVAVVLGNRAAFAEHRLEQAAAVRRGENVAHRAAEQRRARGERREEHPFFPHPRDHVVAERRIEPRAAEHVGHRAHARRFTAREFAEGDPVRVVEVHDALLAIERRRDHAQPAEQLRGAEPVAQHVEMAHPVEHRQDQRLRADERRERLNCIVEAVRLAAQQHEIERRDAGPASPARTVCTFASVRSPRGLRISSPRARAVAHQERHVAPAAPAGRRNTRRPRRPLPPEFASLPPFGFVRCRAAEPLSGHAARTPSPREYSDTRYAYA